jgi:hypothetical protein
MATIPQTKPVEQELDFEEIHPVEPGHKLPGYTVDALLDQGNVEEARTELERLLLEGIDSGPGIPVTPEFWEQLHARARGEIRPKR